MNKGSKIHTVTGIKLKEYRWLSGLSQEELAENSGISIRTIQRIEKGLSTGSAYTLRSLANALNVDIIDLASGNGSNSSPGSKNPIKLLNLSALFVLIIPLSNIILPFLIFRRNENNKDVNEEGRKILSFQILWTLITLLMMFLIPIILVLLFEPLRAGSVPLFVPVYLIAVVVNIFFTIRFALDLNDQSTIIKSLPNIL